MPDAQTKKKAAFFAIFTLMVLLLGNINFSQLAGAKNQFFTLFQFFGPIAGSFLGPAIGAVSVMTAQLSSLMLTGKQLDLITALRFLPLILAAAYFGLAHKNRVYAALIPIACIGLFLMNPVGREVWFYALFWTIPLICAVLPERILLKSLGATFAAHAVGGAIWIWAFPTTPDLWINLIPAVIKERLLFALGIAASYIAINTLIARMPLKLSSMIPKGAVDRKAVISKSILSSI
ncbi:hypothetical protein HYY72_04390 [Candidatus Woesearchaeota archaeon]|nr:hypothetical protein [Candidatus Woesearchaeota archaeon]